MDCWFFILATAGQYKLQAEMFSGGAYGEDQNHLNLTFHNYKDVIFQKKKLQRRSLLQHKFDATRFVIKSESMIRELI